MAGGVAVGPHWHRQCVLGVFHVVAVHMGWAGIVLVLVRNRWGSAACHTGPHTAASVLAARTDSHAARNRAPISGRIAVHQLLCTRPCAEVLDHMHGHAHRCTGIVVRAGNEAGTRLSMCAPRAKGAGFGRSVWYFAITLPAIREHPRMQALDVAPGQVHCSVAMNCVLRYPGAIVRPGAR